MTADPEAPTAGALLAKAVAALPEHERERMIEHLFEVATGGRALVEATAAAGSAHPGKMGGPRREVLLDSVRLLAKGQAIGEIAEELGVPEELVLELLPELPLAVQPKSKLETDALDLFAQGLRRRQVAGRLKLKEKEVARLVLAAVGRENLRYKLTASSPEVASFPAPQWPTPRQQSTGSGYQMVPLRLTGSQHARLKRWCEQHDFSMAVVMRGLIERFLDEQDASAQ